MVSPNISADDLANESRRSSIAAQVTQFSQDSVC